jgi:hypothetical protein
MPVLPGTSCPARILSRVPDDAVQRLPGEPGLRSVSNAAPAAERRRSGSSAGPGFPPAHRGTRAGLAFGAPKTDAGRRIAAIPEALIPGLRWHLACLVAEDDEGLLFTSTSGMPPRHSNFRNRAWLGAIKRPGLGELHFPDLRHQLASASTADGMIRLTLSQQHTADGALVIIPEPECPAGGSGLQRAQPWSSQRLREPSMSDVAGQVQHKSIAQMTAEILDLCHAKGWYDHPSPSERPSLCCTAR